MVDKPNGVEEANDRALRRLRRRWLWVALLYLGGLAGGYWLVDRYWVGGNASQWLGWAGAIMLVELGILWLTLPQNHPPESNRLLPSFGYGTALTLTCGGLLFLLAGFLFAPRPGGWLGWMPALLYTAARLVDYVDGYVARITRYETKLGSTLDIEFDGLGVFIAILLGIGYRALPIWYLPLAFSRQLFIAGIWLRQRRGLPVYAMTPSSNRRIIAGYQTAFISVALWPIFTGPMARLSAIVFALPLIFSFGRDWLVVSGAIDPSSRGYQRFRATIKNLVEGWLPLAARVSGTLIAIGLLARALPDMATWRALLSPAAQPSAWLWALVALCGLALLPYLLGIVGRVAALPLLGLAWLDLAANEIDIWGNAWLLVAAIIVTHAGSGHAALWRPEEFLLRRRPGAHEDVT